MQIGFLFNAQDHQLFHALPIACELSRLHPGFNVEVLAGSPAQLLTAERLAELYPGHGVAFGTLAAPPWPGSRPPKLAMLLANRSRLQRFDALVVPERTSTVLRRLGVSQPRLIHCFHGSSGHDRVTDRRISRFDLLLAPSRRRLDRLAAAQPLRPGHAAVVGYAKLDLVARRGPGRRLFGNGRPTVLYNPHHWLHKSSWPLLGRDILGHFAAQDRFNLIFAPHVRLRDKVDLDDLASRYAGHPHLHVDPGSPASLDMTYTQQADIYLGDVSSQVMEFLTRPRPCLFLDPRGTDWHADADFATWRLGRVVDSVAAMAAALAGRRRWQGAFHEAQVRAAAEAFPRFDRPAPQRAAEAIATFLRDGMLGPEWIAAPAAHPGEKRCWDATPQGNCAAAG